MGFQTETLWQCVKANQVHKPMLDRLTEASLQRGMTERSRTLSFSLSPPFSLSLSLSLFLSLAVLLSCCLAVLLSYTLTLILSLSLSYYLTILLSYYLTILLSYYLTILLSYYLALTLTLTLTLFLSHFLSHFLSLFPSPSQLKVINCGPENLTTPNHRSAQDENVQTPRTTRWCLYKSSTTSLSLLLQPILDGRQRERCTHFTHSLCQTRTEANHAPGYM